MTPDPALRSEDAPFRLQGRLVLGEAKGLLDSLRKQEETLRGGDTFPIDLSEVSEIDGASAAILLGSVRRLRDKGVTCEISGAGEGVREIVSLYESATSKKPGEPKPQTGMIVDVGRGTLALVLGIKEVLGFVGQVVIEALGVIRRPQTGNWRDIVPIAERSGADAVPIVVFINFLVGFVMGFQGAKQLKMFGANIFVADLVGLSVTRELGPLMTAIILSGRSGAAFAAELGTMKVSEEIDALRTLGFGPMRYLVLPRTLALVLVAPVLTLLADFVGIAGGLLVGVTSLNLSVAGYWQETRKVIHAWDINSGLLKAVAFALVISLISCQQGFATTGGAEGVGRRTTTSVVSSLFALILVDTAFTVFFRVFDL
ncbi:MAG: MlaE family lipid ABC transporter permease subunit [Polyangiaceae bacterium]|nr:MlaE family lipid ABC transporter permease subunit [Polyangiaceae bacterium]